MSAPKSFLASIVLSALVVSSVNLPSYTPQSEKPPGGDGRIGAVGQSKS